MGHKNCYIGVMVVLLVMVQVNIAMLNATGQLGIPKTLVKGSSNWTVGVEVGNTRTTNVTICEGVCKSITPIGTLITIKIVAINDSYVTYSREFKNSLDPEFSFQKIYQGTFAIPREGFEGSPGITLPALEHPLTTNNMTYLKNELATNGFTIVSETDLDLQFQEKYWSGSTYYEWNATIHKKTGWLLSFSYLVKYANGGIQLEVKHDILISPPSTTTPAPPPDLTIIIVEMVTLLLGMLVGLTGFVYYRKKGNLEGKENESLSLLFEPEHIRFLRKIYHKLILGLDQHRTYLANELELPAIEKIKASNSKVIVKLFPPEIRKDLTSEIKGRSVLVLVELAYQRPENRYQAYLVKNLKIPQQTVAYELKRLQELEYVREHRTEETLYDVRYKYYELTEKGLLFLHILKDVITNSLIEYQS